ncbi:efflux RND transporter periplasmic adaptor subunit [Orrella sp. 11846]|uniref:efflux RND transporter periplasmic adaptor subunit n=1 Tax=Orrella sp. 11846 TaxID=3409913 RepID=UPI003B59D74E
MTQNKTTAETTKTETTKTDQNTQTLSTHALSEALKVGGSRRGGWRKWFAALIVLVLLAGLYLWWAGDETAKVSYLTQTVQRGELVVTATATGTLQPTQSVEVGSELSGTVETVLVQENDQVKQGQLLASLDTSKLHDAITRSEASLAAAHAQVAVAAATVQEAQATYSRMEDVHRRSGGKVPAATEMEVAQAALARAKANEQAAKANVQQMDAELKTNQTNLEKAQIRSPVDGVVLKRQVEPGNTVVASMSAPVLFMIAQDLAQMELQVNVDEADVATIVPGLDATFTVSAWAGREFAAQIERVGLGSTTTDNVVTYKTILQVDNEDLALRPGMTATATIFTARAQDALLVPNAALRYTPQEAPQAASSGSSFVSRLVPMRMPRPKTVSPREEKGMRSGQVWVLERGVPVAVPVQIGLTNGRLTEVTGGDLRVGADVVVGQELQR